MRLVPTRLIRRFGFVDLCPVRLCVHRLMLILPSALRGSRKSAPGSLLACSPISVFGHSMTPKLTPTVEKFRDFIYVNIIP